MDYIKDLWLHNHKPVPYSSYNELITKQTHSWSHTYSRSKEQSMQDERIGKPLKWEMNERVMNLFMSRLIYIFDAWYHSFLRSSRRIYTMFYALCTDVDSFSVWKWSIPIRKLYIFIKVHIGIKLLILQIDKFNNLFWNVQVYHNYISRSTLNWAFNMF